MGPGAASGGWTRTLDLVIMRRIFNHRAARALWGSLAGLEKAMSACLPVPVCPHACPHSCLLASPICLLARTNYQPAWPTFLPAFLSFACLPKCLSVCLHDCLSCQSTCMTAWTARLPRNLCFVQTDWEFSTYYSFIFYSADKMEINRLLGIFLQLSLIPRQITFNINIQIWLIVTRRLLTGITSSWNFPLLCKLLIFFISN